jgi:hypothetical protein
MAVRVPAILDGVLERNPDYSPAIRGAVSDLAAALRQDLALPAVDPALPYAAAWTAEFCARAGERWLATDWFFAETYAYRQLVDRVGFWTAERDPFVSYKIEEYAGDAHAAALEGALGLSGSRAERLHALLAAALWGNRIDLSFTASRVRGMAAQSDDLLADDREPALRAFCDGAGPVQIVADNAGTELTLDLVLAEFVASELRTPVVLHLKAHPTFVSDATVADVRRFLETPRGAGSQAWLTRLREAIDAGSIELRPHPFWNSPQSLWELPGDLCVSFERARIVMLKGDANYRRALGDAVWPPETRFSEATAYFPAPLLALRTLKSDPIVGLGPGQAEALDAVDPTWRVNGRRGVASLGGRTIAA